MIQTLLVVITSLLIAAPGFATEPEAAAEVGASATQPEEPAGGTPEDGDRVPVGSLSEPVITIVGDYDDLPQIAGSVHVVDEKKLEEREYNDIHRVLQEVPGVYVREEDGYGLRPNIGIRGASSDRSAKVTLMEDGILFGPAPYSAPAAYFFPLTTRMVAVEVFKGPSSIQYGPHTIGGAVNLVTRPIPENPEAATDLSYGENNTWKTHGWGGRRFGKSGVLLEAVHLETDGFKNLDGPGSDTGFSRNEMMLKVDRRWSVGGIKATTLVKAGYSTEDSNETYLGISDDDFSKHPLLRYPASQNDNMDYHRWEVEYSNSAAITPDLNVQMTAYRHDLTRKWRKLNRFEQGAPSLHDIFADPIGRNAIFISILRGDSDSATPLDTLLVGTNDREFVSQGIQFASTWTPTTGPLSHTIDAGLRIHYDEIVRDHTEDPYRMVNKRTVRTTQPQRQIADNTGKALALASYLRDDIEWRSLIVTPGIRIESIDTDYTDRLPTLNGQPEVDDSDNQTVVIPGIGAVTKVIGGLSALAGVHRGFSPVAPGQSGSADPEESINYEFGLRYWAEMVHAEAIGFYNDYDNILATCRQDSGCDPEDVDKQFNGGGADIYGLEFLADAAHYVGYEVYGYASLAYTFTHTEFRDSFTSASAVFGDVEAGDEIPYVPEQQVNVQLGLDRGPFGVSSTLTYVGEMRDVAGRGNIPEYQRIEDHLVADLFAHWDFSEHGRLYFGTDNVTDADYIVSRRPFGARPGKPLQVYGGIKYRFGG